MTKDEKHRGTEGDRWVAYKQAGEDDGEHGGRQVPWRAGAMEDGGERCRNDCQCQGVGHDSGDQIRAVIIGAARPAHNSARGRPGNSSRAAAAVATGSEKPSISTHVPFIAVGTSVGVSRSLIDMSRSTPCG